MLRFSPADVEPEPFPHLSVAGAVEPDAYANLRREFPDAAYFADKPKLFGGRNDLTYGQYGTSDFESFLDGAPTWRMLFDSVRSDDFRQRATSIFAAYFKRYGYRPSPPGAPDFALSLCGEGYQVQPHHDKRYHFVQGLLYFGREAGCQGGELQIYRPRCPKAMSECEQYPDAAGLEVDETIEPEQNRLFLWLNTPNSYHGTTAMRGVRRFLYFALNVSTDTCWDMGTNVRHVAGDDTSPFRARRGYVQVVCPTRS